MDQMRLEGFENSNSYLDDQQLLNRKFQDQGYLFFKGVLDRTEVANVKQEFIEVLQDQDIVKNGSTEPVWTGAGLERLDDNPLYRLSSYDDLLESPEMMRVVESLFKGSVFRYRNTDIRFALPHDEKHLTPPHQDHFYIRQTDQFCTAWVPLMPIGLDGGVLAIAKNSHKMGLLEHVEHETAHSYIFRGRKQRGVPADALPGPWLTTEYAPGDVLLFHSLSVHQALPNRSDRIRLSLDVRYQSSNIPRTWQSQQTILAMREYRKTAQRLATEAGLSEPIFESLLIEMMKRGMDATPTNMNALAAEFGTQQSIH